MLKRVIVIAVALAGIIVVTLATSVPMPARRSNVPLPGTPSSTSTPAIPTPVRYNTATPTVIVSTPTPTVDMSLAAAQILERGKKQQAIGDDAAVSTFRSILERFPDSTLTAEARYRLAESLLAAHREDEALGVLQTLMQSESASAFAHPATFLAAAIQQRKGQLDGALGLYQRYLAQDDLLAGYVQREIASIYTALKQPTQAIAAHKAALATDLPPDYAQGSRRGIATLATGLKDYQQALEWWTRYDEGARSAAEKALAGYSIGLIQKDMGAGDAATATFLRLVQSYPETWGALQALETLLKDGRDVPLMQQGQVYFANRRNEAAQAAYQRYLALYPDGDGAPRARYHLALIQQRLGNLERAIVELDTVHDLYPNEALVRSAWLELARSLLRLERRTEAAAAYERVARWYPQSVEAEQALWEGGMTYYRLGRFADAARLLLRLRQGFPSSRTLSRTLFWEGKSLLASGDTEGARQVLELAAAGKRLDYYRLRAGEILAAAVPAATPSSARLSLPLDVIESERVEFVRWIETWAGNRTQPAVHDNVHMRRGVELWRLGLRAEAATELALARADLRNDAWALLAYADEMRQLGLPYQAMAAANRLLALSSLPMLDAPRYLLRLLYPAEYADQVQEMASQYGVDLLWFLALIRQESGFDRYALSSAEARGLTQVIPATATEIAGRLGITDFRQDDLFKPIVSLRFGAWYMGQGLKLTNGNMLMALAGYNGGLGNALRWARQQGQQLDNDLFVEDISFEETNLFVRVIYEHHHMYKLLWGFP